jgi:hypothetical protein
MKTHRLPAAANQPGVVTVDIFVVSVSINYMVNNAWLARTG